MTKSKPKTNRWNAYVIIAILTFIALIFALIKFNTITTPWFSGYSKEYVQAKEHLLEMQGGDRLLGAQLDHLRKKYTNELDQATREELLQLGEDLHERDRASSELLTRMGEVGLWGGDEARSMMRDAQTMVADTAIISRFSALAERLPQAMLDELLEELRQADLENGRLMDEMKVIRAQVNQERTKLQKMQALADSLARANAELQRLDSLKRLGLLQDSLNYARLKREAERLDSLNRLKPDVSITELQFLPVRARRSPNGKYRLSQVERSGFVVSFKPIVHDVIPEAHRTVILEFEYPSRQGDDVKPLTKTMTIKSGEIQRWEHRPKWPNQGRYMVRVLYNNRELNRATFEAD